MGVCLKNNTVHLCSDYKDPSDKKYKDKEKMKHKDGSTEKNKDKHKEKRKEDKVSQAGAIRHFRILGKMQLDIWLYCNNSKNRIS